MPSLDRLIVVDTEQLPVVHLKTRGGGEILPYSTDLRLPRKDESRFATLVVPFGEDGASRAVASSVRGAAETMEGYLQEGLKVCLHGRKRAGHPARMTGRSSHCSRL
eukprot:Sspe_Gene.22917::Locus_8811_Transcript_2_4_Confidence_0.625_Length_473::g.22917::m.22917